MLFKLSIANLSKLLVTILFLIGAVGCGGGEAGIDAKLDINNAPLLQLTSPTHGDTQSEVNNVSFVATATDTEDGDLSSNIQWESNIDGILGSGSEISVKLSTGNHTVSASVTDSGEKSSEQFVDLTILENNLPNLSISSPTSGGSQNEYITLQLTANAIDQEDGDISSNIEWKSSIDGNLGIGSQISVLLTDGNHIITATVTDSANESSEDNINFTIIDVPPNTPPSVTISSPTSGGSQSELESLTLVASAADAEDGDISGNIQWQSNIDGILGTGSQITTTLTTGNHIILASVTDSGNISSQDSINFTLIENSAPTVNITSPTDGASQSETLSLTLTATATDVEDGNINQSIKWNSTIDGDLGTGAQITVSLTPGEHLISSEVIDSGNKLSQDSINITILENGVPEISITSPSNGLRQNTLDSLTLRATAEDQEDGNISSSIQWRSNIDGSLGNGSQITTNLSPGNHRLFAKVTDSDNKSSERSVNVVILAADGTAHFSWTAPTQNTDDSDLTDLDGFIVYYGRSANQLTNSIIINSSTTESITIENLRKEETYYFSVSAFNALNIESERTVNVSKIIGS